MKLYSIIYINEGARTATEALDKGVAAISKDHYQNLLSNRNEHNIVLVSTDRVFSVLKTLEESGWNLNVRLEDYPATEDEIAKRIARRAIAGMIDYSHAQDDLWSVNKSAGVASFGPLAYQMVMYETGEWLMSDDSLKPASQFVWQKMYELSDKGVYQRKWLGNWLAMHLLDRVEIGQGQHHLNQYVEQLSDESIDVQDEQVFLDYLQERKLNPASYGWLWAYKATSHDTKIQETFDNGNKLVRLLVEKYPKFTEKDAARLIEMAGSKFFRRLYGGPASYSE